MSVDLPKKFTKFIVGAALKDFKAIETYSYLFTHAQADIIDISAFPLSLISAQKGIDKALAEDSGLTRPELMVSVNMAADPHFRRIKLDQDNCTECQLCIPSCPSGSFFMKDGFKYDEDYCFGCSNCLDYCNFDALSFENWSAFEASSITELERMGATAIEIHINDDLEKFKNFYQSLPNHNLLESISLGSKFIPADQIANYALEIVKICTKDFSQNKQLILQIDGVSQSGARNIKNSDQNSLDKAIEVLAIKEQIPENIRDNIYIQVAGGTTTQTMANAQKQNIDIDGVGIGSYARKLFKDKFEINELDSCKSLAQNLINT